MKGNGWIKLYRLIEQSNVWKKPSDWLKIWLYLLLEVNHNNGEGFFTWEKIEQDCHISKKQLRRFFDFAVLEKMIIREKTTRGVRICILNWKIYQHELRAHTKGTSEGTTEGTSNIPQEPIIEANKERSNFSEGTSEGTTEGTSKGHSDKQEEVLQEVRNKKRNTYIPEHEIFDYWNSKKIQIHRSFEKFKEHITAALKIYTEQEIKDAIDNYAYVLSNHDRFYFTHKWEIDKFFTRGIERFLPVNFKEKDYLKRVYKSKAELEEERSMGILSKVFKEEEEKDERNKV